MRVLKGIIIMLVSLAIALVEIYYLLYIPLTAGASFSPGIEQYWALVAPVLTMTVVIMFTSAWIGYTIVKTPEPIKFHYEEAYEIALNEVEEEKSQ